MSRGLLGLLGTLVVAALAGCTGEAAPTGAGSSPAGRSDVQSATGSAAPRLPEVRPATEAPRPEPGRCFRLRYADALATTSDVPSTSCRRPHTSYTFFVGALDLVVDGHLLGVDSRRAQEQVAAECPQRAAGFLGGNVEDRRLSMLRAIWFTPTIQESDAGADWFRCDVVAVAGDERLATLEGRLRGVLDRPSGDRWAMCGTAEPGTAGFRRVLCSARHSWVAVATVNARAPRAARFPGPRALTAQGGPVCENAARAAADDPLTVTWGYEPPTREQWRAGRRYGICWAPA